MENEKKLSESESMELITSMINSAKNNFEENGFLYLLWGWVVLGCCLVQFSATYFFHSDKGGIVWVATFLVAIYQLFYLSRKTKKRRVKTYMDELYGMVWIAFSIALFCFIYVLALYEKIEMVSSVILILYGIPTFLSGALLKFKPLVWGGVFCWVLGVVSPFVENQYRILLIALALLVAWIIPGYLLRSRYEKSNQMNEKQRNEF